MAKAANKKKAPAKAQKVKAIAKEPAKNKKEKKVVVKSNKSKIEKVKKVVIEKKNSKKKEKEDKEKAKDEFQDEQNENKEHGGGRYIFFKNPKYLKLAEKFVKASSDEIKGLTEKENFSLAEKIHVGNLMGGAASTYVKENITPNESTPLCYDPITKAKFIKTYQELLESKTVKQLQEMLIKNEQAKTAAKNILCLRVADGMVMGRIPKCPACLGGRMKFNFTTGEYYCAGFIDGGYFYSDLGDDYIFCNKRYKMNEITREEWRT